MRKFKSLSRIFIPALALLLVPLQPLADEHEPERFDGLVPVKDADLYLTVETRDATQSKDIQQRLQELGYEPTLLQD